jgi:hypothetical protein
MKYSEEDIDIMLFDYLEGNLPEDEIKLIESQIASDPLIKEELTLWESSYIREDFFDTSVVESSILRKKIPSFNFTFYLNSVLVCCLCFLSGTNFNAHSDTYALLNMPAPIPIELKSENRNSKLPELKSLLTTGPLPASAPSGKLKFNEKPNMMQANNFMEFTQLSSIKKIEMEVIGFSKNPPSKLNLLREKKATTLSRKSIRRHDRSLRKMQNKAARERMATKFIKGNIPYVVPIDPNNF